MTCKELRWYFEDHLRDVEVRSARGAVAEHVATCADCAQFVAAQRELGRNLRHIREAAGQVPESLDTSVLLNYRRQMADQKDPRRVSMSGKFHPRLLWAFAAVAAGLVVAAGFLLLSRHSTTNAVVYPASTEAKTISVKETPRNPAFEVQRTKPTRAAGRRMRPTSPEPAPSLPVHAVRLLPEGFRSLMYCDELSCPQDMEMIRVQLPSSAMPRQVSSFIQTSRSVTADVLVGPDGIARGIRFEEIEF